MGLPVTRYTHLDAGAPQLVNCTPSEWINILKKVLVEGYGSKAPLGWNLAFEDAGTFTAAFRNSTAEGSGGYLQIGSATGANTTAANIKLITAHAMAGINLFTRPSWARLFSLNISAKGWEIIGTSVGFWLIQHKTIDLLNYTAAINYQVAFFIGDMNSFYPNDPSRFILYSATTTNADVTANPNYQAYIGGSTSTAAKIYELDGGNGFDMYAFTSAITSQIGNNANYGDAEILGVQHIISPMILRQGFQVNLNNPTLPNIRGSIPGLLVSNFAGYGSVNWPKTLSFNGYSHELLRGYLGGHLWVNTEVWYE